MRIVDPHSWQFGIKHAMDRTLAGLLLLTVFPMPAHVVCAFDQQ